MKKRMVSLFCALALLLTLSPFTATAEDLGEWDSPLTEGFFQSGDYFCFQVDPDNVWIMGYDGTASSLTLPATLDGSRVTTISSGAFSGNETITSVTVSEGILYIAEFAFSECPNLQTVSLPRTIEEVGEGAFADCASLATIRVDENCAALLLQDGVLFDKDSGILLCYPARRPGTTYTVPEWVTGIGNGAFSNACDLVSVTLPESTLAIGALAFYGCTSLTTVPLPAGLQFLFPTAFMSCPSLTAFTVAAGNTILSVRDGVLFDAEGEALFAYPAGRRDTSYTVPEGTTAILPAAFSDCAALTDIRLPDTLQAILPAAFYNCTELRAITIPAGVTHIDISVFVNCTALTTIAVASGNADYYDVDGVLFTSEEDALLCYPAGRRDESYAVPEGTTAIVCEAFSGCASLRSVTLPRSVSTIYTSAFIDCPALARIDIPASVFLIDYDAIENCPALTIHGLRGTAAEWFAETADIPFVASGDALAGDTNADEQVNTADAVLTLQYAAELIDKTQLSTLQADVNGDGKINTADAVLILQYAAGLIDKFPGS